MRIREAMPADIPAVARVQVESWRTSYPGIVPQTFLDSMSVETAITRFHRILNEPKNQAFLYVGEVDGRIVGYVMGGLERHGDPFYAGELYAIYLLAEAQQKGLGQALVNRVARRLEKAGVRSMLLWVFADNPARRFYESLGGKHVRDGSFEIEGTVISEVAYGWDDLSQWPAETNTSARGKG
jgi:ribosomal protein S18 acetylase RimI-like enzyme